MNSVTHNNSFDNIESDKLKQRVEWVDLAKGIGIFLVVLGHSGWPEKFRWWIWSFHMPLFFLLSGLVFSIDKYPDFLHLFKKRNISLLRPYFFFSIIVLFAVSFIEPHFLLYLKDTLLYGWLGFALWFIPVLYFTEICYFFIRKNLNEKATFLVVLFFSFIGYALSFYNIHSPYKLEVVFTAILYYGIGNLSFQKIKQAFVTIPNLYILPLALLFLVINITFCYLNSVSLDMAKNVIGNCFYANISAFSGIAFVLLTSHFIASKGYLNFFKYCFNYLGLNTLVLLAIHQTLKIYLILMFEKIHANALTSLILRHSLLWIVLIICIYIVNKYVPYIKGKDNSYKNTLTPETP